MIDITAKEFYDKIADKYEKEYKTPVDKAEDKIIMGLLNTKAHSNILDLGCGTGLFLEYCKNPHFYFGIDISEKMIEIAERKYKKDLINFEVLKIEDIEIYEHKFYNHIVSLFGSMSYVEYINEIITMAYYKLFFGGELFFMVYSKSYKDRVHSHNLNGGRYHIKNVKGYTKKELENIIKEEGIKHYKVSGFRLIKDKYINWIKNEKIIKKVLELEYKILGRLFPDLCHFMIIEIKKE